MALGLHSLLALGRCLFGSTAPHMASLHWLNFYSTQDFKIESFYSLLVLVAPKERFSFCYHDDFFLGSTVVFLSLFCAMELFFSNLIVIVL